MVREKVIEQFTKDIALRDLRSHNGKYIQYREQYIRNKKRGDYRYIVPEWDEFQRERELKEALEFADNKIKGEIIMSERKVRIQLSRDYQVVEVEVSNIEDRNDFAVEKDWVRTEAERLLNEITNKPNVTPKAVTATEYVEAHEVSKKPANGVYTAQHITTKFLKGKQVDIALKAINSGKVTINQVNNLQSWDEQQALLFPPRKY